MRILICGANGQVGREVVDRAAGFGLDVLATTREQLDITQPDAVARAMEEFRPGLVINAAAFTHVDHAETQREQAYRINRDGPRILAEATGGAGVPLFHISTDYVFSGDASTPYGENHPTGPTGVYGASKLAGEQAVQAATARHLILRTSWVYGAKGNNFVKTMLRLGRQRSSLSVVHDQVGCPTSAASIADVLLALASRYAREGDLAWGLYHYCGAPACSWYDFATAIFRQAVAQGLLTREPQVSPITTAQYPTPARRPAWSVLDCSKLEQTFGISPKPWPVELAVVIEALARSESTRRFAASTSQVHACTGS